MYPLQLGFSIFRADSNNFHFKSLFFLDLTFSLYKSDLPWFKTSWRNGGFRQISPSQKMDSTLNLTLKPNFKQWPLTWIMNQKTEKDDICLTVIKANKICQMIEKSSLILLVFSSSPWYACWWYKNYAISIVRNVRPHNEIFLHILSVWNWPNTAPFGALWSYWATKNSNTVRRLWSIPVVCLHCRET